MVALLLCCSARAPLGPPLGPRPRRPRGPHHPVCFFCFRLCGYALCEKMRPWLTQCTKPPTSSSSMPAAARASRKQESSLQQLKLLTPLRKHSSGLAARCWRDLRVIIKLSSLASLRKPCASIHFRAICLGLGQGLLSGANKHTDHRTNSGFKPRITDSRSVKDFAISAARSPNVSFPKEPRSILDSQLRVLRVRKAEKPPTRAPRPCDAELPLGLDAWP